MDETMEASVHRLLRLPSSHKFRLREEIARLPDPPRGLDDGTRVELLLRDDFATVTPIVRNIGKGDSAEGAVLSTLLGLVLESLDVRVRLAVADALTTREDLLARPQVLATLAEVALRESTQAVRTAAVCGLTLSKMPALLAAVAAMPHRWTHRRVVITYLVRRETYRRDSVECVGACAPRLAELLGDPDQEVRAYSMRMLLSVPMALLRVAKLAFAKFDDKPEAVQQFAEDFALALEFCAESLPLSALARFIEDLHEAQGVCAPFRRASRGVERKAEVAFRPLARRLGHEAALGTLRGRDRRAVLVRYPCVGSGRRTGPAIEKM